MHKIAALIENESERRRRNNPQMDPLIDPDTTRLEKFSCDRPIRDYCEHGLNPNCPNRTTMPVPDFKTYCAILDSAHAGRFALPAVNVTSLSTANAVLRGLAESKADGIIQISTGGGAVASGTSVKDSALGAISIAEHVHRVADRYPIYVALHTDHCLKDKLDKFVIPLVEETEKRRAASQPNLFTGHMFDGSNLSLKENLDISE